MPNAKKTSKEELTRLLNELEPISDEEAKTLPAKESGGD